MTLSHSPRAYSGAEAILLRATASIALLLGSNTVGCQADNGLTEGNPNESKSQVADATTSSGTSVPESQPPKRAELTVEVSSLYADGSQYTGEKKDGEPHGEGIYTYADGRQYEGHFKNGDADGHGKLTSPNGDVCEGEFREGSLDGKGKCTYADGKIEEGAFRAGKLDGIGSIKYPNGESYEGQFRKGLPDGEGILKRAGGTAEAVWENGELIPSNVKVTTETFTYEGAVDENFKPTGWGTLTQNGVVINCDMSVEASFNTTFDPNTVAKNNPQFRVTDVDFDGKVFTPTIEGTMNLPDGSKAELVFGSKAYPESFKITDNNGCTLEADTDNFNKLYEEGVRILGKSE